MNVYFQLGLTIAVVLFIFGIAKMNGYPIEYDNPVMRTAPGVCTVTCCAAFAPAPVPVGGPVMVGLMAVTVAVAAWCWLRKRT